MESFGIGVTEAGDILVAHLDGDGNNSLAEFARLLLVLSDAKQSPKLRAALALDSRTSGHIFVRKNGKHVGARGNSDNVSTIICFETRSLQNDLADHRCSWSDFVRASIVRSSLVLRHEAYSSAEQALRTNLAECRPTDTDKCATNVIKEWDNDRWLGFIELTDAGNYHDLERMQQVLKRLGDDAHERDLLIVTYVHGWGHNAEEGDDNVRTAFEALLKDMANIEASRAPSERRQVVGIYMGWRGSLVNLTPFWIPTFWSRKAVAEDIGHAAAAVFATINKVWLEANSECRSDKRRANTRMLTIGHSFGGLLLRARSCP